MTALTGPGTQGLDSDGPGANKIISSVYRTRDQLMTQDDAGAHFMTQYYDVSGRASELLVENPELRGQAAELLQDLAPPLSSLAGGDGEEVKMTTQLAGEMNGFLDDLGKAADKAGGGHLAEILDEEQRLINIKSLVGMNFDQVLNQLNKRVDAASEPIGDVPPPSESTPTPAPTETPTP